MWFMTSAPNHQQQLSGNKLWLLLLLLLLAACGGSGNDGNENDDTSSNQQNDGFYTVDLRVNVGQASVFAQPDRNADIVYTLIEGDVVEAIGRSSEDSLGTVFYAIEVDDVPGWIASSQVEPQGDTSGLLFIPVAAVDPTEVARDSNAPPTPGVGVVARPYTSAAPIYTEPSTESDILRLAGETETLQVALIAQGSDFIRYFGVRLEAGFGWITEEDFLISGDISSLPPVSIGTPTPSPRAATNIPPTSTVPPTSNAITSTPTTDDTPQGNVVTSTPRNTSDPVTRTPTPTVAPSITPTPPSIQLAAPPPLVIDLPESWQEGHVSVPITSAFADDVINLSIYEGPVFGDTYAYIWVLWNFDAIPDGTSSIADGTITLSLWPNALLYLRSFLFAGCNIGFDPELRRPYTVGTQTGDGAIFSAVGCGPEIEDVAGWFVAAPTEFGNYIFYIGVTPVDNVLDAQDALQGLLDSVEFLPPES